MIYGVDLSFANGTVDWSVAAKSDAVKFVYSRVCYGANEYDDDGYVFTDNHDGAKANNIPFGAYMFWLAWQDGVQQAQHFLAAASGCYGQLAPVVDVEEGSGLYGWGASLEARIANLAATLNAIQDKLGQPIIYTNPDTWASFFASTDAFSGHRFWIADYGAAAGSPDAVTGAPRVVLHQYSDGSGQPPISGMSKPDNNVDRDVLIGDDLSILNRG